MSQCSETTERPALSVTAVNKVSEEWIEHVTFSNDEKYIAVCSYTETSIINIDDSFTFEVLAVLHHDDIVWKSAFSQTDEMLFTCCADGNLYAWDTNSSQMLYQLEIDKGSVFGISVSPDKLTLAVSTVRGKIAIVCLVERIICTSFEGHIDSVEDICYSQSGKLLASCAKDGKIKLWRNIEAKQCSVSECNGHLHWVYTCSFSADEKYIISTSADKTTKLWSVESCECLQTFQGHKNIVWNSQFVDKAGSTLVSCSSDGTIRLWGMESGKLLETLWNPGSYDYSDGLPRDQLFWCATNQTGTRLIVGSYHGNVYTLSISSDVLRKKNEIKLFPAKQEAEKKYQSLAKAVVASVVANAVRTTGQLELSQSLSPMEPSILNKT